MYVVPGAIEIIHRRHITAQRTDVDGLAHHGGTPLIPASGRHKIHGNDGHAGAMRHKNNTRLKGQHLLRPSVELSFGINGHHLSSFQLPRDLMEGVEAEILLIHLDTMHSIEKPGPQLGGVQILGCQRVHPAFPEYTMNQYGINKTAMIGRGHKAALDLMLFAKMQNFRAHPYQRRNGACDLDEVVQKIIADRYLLFLVLQVVFGTQ